MLVQLVLGYRLAAEPARGIERSPFPADPEAGRAVRLPRRRPA